MANYRDMRFDAEAFALIVHTKRFVAGKSLRDFGVDLGVGYNALHRVEAKAGVGVAKFLIICHALGEDPFTFLLNAQGKRVSRGTPPETGLQNRDSEA